ncbi:hypothetical protein [Kitasatospora sp. MBT66]|uniref:hypothetical protein n=1 Tax=Kitasatospora sp. MBT66 TaxID=1444769 RepID=UPI0005BAC9E3|nr:hypothetical protein [Kitasatospora sp. MBT66]
MTTPHTSAFARNARPAPQVSTAARPVPHRATAPHTVRPPVGGGRRTALAGALFGVVLLAVLAGAAAAAAVLAAVRAGLWQASLLAAFVLVAGIGAGAAAQVRSPLPAPPRGHRPPRLRPRNVSHRAPHRGPVRSTDVTARTADASHAVNVLAGEPGPAMPVAVLVSRPGTGTGQLEEAAGPQRTTTYPDGSLACVRPDTAGAGPADLAAQLLPDATEMTGYLRVDGHLLMAQERRTDGWTVRATRWRGLLVAARTPAGVPGIPQVLLTAHGPATEPEGSSS